MPATVLVLVETINDYLPILEHQGFHLILAPTPAERAQAIATHGARIDAVLTRGPLGLTAEEIAALPALKIITVIGAGYEHVDLQAASDRGITVTNGAGVNASSVADHALAMLLALVRDIPRCDAAVRRGEWPKIMRPSLANKRLGFSAWGRWAWRLPSVLTLVSTCRSVTTTGSCAVMCPMRSAPRRPNWHGPRIF